MISKKLLPLALSLAFFGACASAPTSRHRATSGGDRTFRDGSSLGLIEGAEDEASSGGRKVLAQARVMTVEDKEILPGACWDYVNTVWNRAGFSAKKRETVFKSKKGGPYAQTRDIQPGDWLYFINHSYNKIEHSALFVTWKDEGDKIGYCLSYAGEKRKEPARYLSYDLKSVFQIIRAKD